MRVAVTCHRNVWQNDRDLLRATTDSEISRHRKGCFFVVVVALGGCLFLLVFCLFVLFYLFVCFVNLIEG